MSGVPTGSGCDPTPEMRERDAFAVASTLGARFEFASSTWARASSMRAIDDLRSRLPASASSTSAFNSGSSNVVHQRSSSALSAAVAEGGGRSSCGGAGWLTAHPASAMTSAAARARVARKGGLDMIGSGFGLRRVAGRRRRQSRVQLPRVVDLVVQLLPRARLGNPALEDQAEEPRNEEYREERGGEHAAHHAGAHGMT